MALGSGLWPGLDAGVTVGLGGVHDLFGDDGEEDDGVARSHQSRQDDGRPVQDGLDEPGVLFPPEAEGEAHEHDRGRDGERPQRAEPYRPPKAELQLAGEKVRDRRDHPEGQQNQRQDQVATGAGEIASVGDGRTADTVNEGKAPFRFRHRSNP